MRKTAILLCILFVFSVGYGKELAGHTVMVSIDRAGNAHVTEKYTLQLNSSEYMDFDRIAKRTSTDLSIWQLFFKDISATVIADISGLTTSASTAGAGNFGNNVVVDYDVAGFAENIDKIGRDNIFFINATKFAFYQQDIDKFIIPWKSELQIKFDQTIKKTDMIEVTPAPSQSSTVDNQYTLFWYGSRIDNRFVVEYKVEENVAEFDWSGIANSTYLFFYGNPLYSMAVLVILILIFICRKPIAGLITESFGGEEEIELPKRGV